MSRAKLGRSGRSVFGTMVLAAALPIVAGGACSPAANPTPAGPVVLTAPAGDQSPTPVGQVGRLPVPISGGTLLVLRDGHTAVASDPDRDLISVVDLGAGTLRGQIGLDAGSEPGRLVEDRAGRVHVVLRGAGTVITLDPAKARVLARRTLCAAPRGLAYESGKDLLHVACAGGELVSIGAMDAAPVRTLNLDRDLRDVAVSNGRLMVTTFRTANLLMVPDSGPTTRLAPPRTRAVFSSSVNVGRMAVPLPPPPAPNSAATTPDATGSSASPAVAWRLVDGPDGQPMMLHQRGVDDEIGTQPNAYANGVSCAGIVETAISTMAPDGMGLAPAMTSSAPLMNAVVAVDLAVSPDGRQVAVVSAGNAGTDQQLQFYDVADVTNPPSSDKPCLPGATMPTRPDVLSMPAGAQAQKPGDYRPPNGEVIAVAFDPAGNVIVQSRQPATLQILTQRLAPIVLSNDISADTGHQLFHAATTGKVACASCHPEGGEDARVWHFAGLGSRRTQSLRGGVMDTAPFHWSGALRNLDDLMVDVFQGRMAGPAVGHGQVDALAHWLDGVRTIPPSAAWHDPAAIDRGKTLFESAGAGCATCHVGPDHTNGTTVSVGTGGVFQVPQLHSLAFRAPYMHDGCAATLADRFGSASCGGGDRHGVTSNMTSAQINDLVAYLETL